MENPLIDKELIQKAYSLLHVEKQRRQKLSQKYDWDLQARKNQHPPEGNWHTWLILAGRGFGKTRTGSETIRKWVDQGVSRRIALLGHTQADVRQVMIEGESGLLSVYPQKDRPKYSPATGQIIWPNGAKASSFSGDAYEQLRGPQFDTAWVDELAKFTYAQEAWDQLCLTLRLGKNPRAIVTTTPRPIPLLFQLVSSSFVQVTSGSTFDNQHNLSPAFLEHVKQNYDNTRLGGQELYGILNSSEHDSLWSPELISRNRLDKIPALEKTVIAVDPAVSDSATSHETGVVVAGKAYNQRGYVLADHSGRYSPLKWAQVAIDAFRKYRANEIVVEVNNGGKVVEQIIHNIDPSVLIKPVYAQYSKKARAEPIVALYEKGKISHIGRFPLLEEQMCNFREKKRNSASDRMDALVWALTELFLSRQPPPPSSASVVLHQQIPKISRF